MSRFATLLFVWMAALLLFVPAVRPAAAQPVPLDDAEREAVVSRIAELLAERYVFEDVGRASGQHLQERLVAGDYDAVADAEAFATILTEDLQHVNHDKHMRVRVHPPEESGAMERPDPLTMRTRMMQRMRERNFGFEHVERMEGNVGYLDLRGFMPEELVRQTAVAAMTFLAHTDAVIIDLRQNGGGSPATVRLLCSYFFDEPTHLNSLYWREGDRTEEFWTLDEVEGARLPDVPLFVLTSSRTFSGAEEFAYNMQTRERATLVGETTGGGANPGGTFPVNEHFEIFIPTGRAINPVTGTNWEGTGVTPEVEVPADEALDRSLALAQEAAEAYRTTAEQRQTAARTALEDALARAETLFDQDRARAEAAVKAALETGLDADLLDEFVINLMGYDCLQGGRTEMAIAVFAFNVATYPASSNVYDSLGEAYMEAGRHEEAIANYKKSLALDPGNANAVRMLAKMGVTVGG